MQRLIKGSILENRWIVGDYIGEGACAHVYNATPKVPLKSPYTNELLEDIDYVVKVIQLPGKGKSKKDKDQEKICNTLNYEYSLYNGILSDFPLKPLIPPPPKCYGSDITLNVRYLVMEKLDSDLSSYCIRNKIAVDDIARIGLQILDGLLWIHQKGFMFIDVKPENFMLKADKLYFIDCKIINYYDFMYLFYF